MRAAAGGPWSEKQFNATIAGNPIRHVEASSSYAMIPLPLHLMYGTCLGLHAPATEDPFHCFFAGNFTYRIDRRGTPSCTEYRSSAERIDFNFHGET